MERTQTDRILLNFSVGGFLLMSISFLLMFIGELKILPGALFWGGLICGIVLQIILRIRVTKQLADFKATLREIWKGRKEIISPWPKLLARINAWGLCFCTILTVAAFLITKGMGLVCYILIAVTSFSLCLHCVWYGKVYFYVENQKKIVRTLRKNSGKNKGRNNKKGAEVK